MAFSWAKLKAEYLRGGVSMNALAQKYGVSFSAVRRRAEKEKWTDLKAESEQKAVKKIADRVVEQKVSDTQKFNDLADLILGKIQEGINSGTIDINQRSMRDITGAIKDLREIKGLKSEADFQEQMARIEKLKRESQQETVDKEIKVIIGNNAEDFTR